MNKSAIGKFLAIALVEKLDAIAVLLFKISKKAASVYRRVWYYTGQPWFNHNYDILAGLASPMWLERGFLPLPFIDQKADILDIGCGDGSFDAYFYSRFARKVTAIDVNHTAIEYARTNHAADNITYIVRDIVDGELTNRYDVILMFAVIEHFSYDDGVRVMKKVRRHLKSRGVFIGSTPIFISKGGHNAEHLNEFTSVPELRKFLQVVFKSVLIKQTRWSDERVECYFFCH